MACHLGVLTDLPCVGVAKKLLQVDGLENNAQHKEKVRAGPGGACRLRRKHLGQPQGWRTPETALLWAGPCLLTLLPVLGFGIPDLA